MLTDAAVAALAGEFPRWRVWVDAGGWHAFRRGAYIQEYHLGAPAFSVHASGPVELAAQLCWQQAGDEHAPGGCPRR
ncbi:MAG TPA: hypothetical protein VH637_17090 [Streptosporangiaceae bacterium]|jgi:hypothetical protein